jgi:hypothetical protein
MQSLKETLMYSPSTQMQLFAAPTRHDDELAARLTTAPGLVRPGAAGERLRPFRRDDRRLA